jgi:hypothetical protein
MRNLRAKMTMIAGLVICLAIPLILSCAAVTPAKAAEPSYLYKTTFVRAAPGKLLELIDLYKSRMDVYDASGDERPFWWRHTQGDQWDLACSAWREDILVLGPPLKSVKKAFEDTAYYHIEICVALPGKQEELFKEREMENIYQVSLGRPENMIFVRDQGAAWDLFTLGCYRDIMHWASSGEITKEKRGEAARRAGFSSPEAIGPYLRTLIDWHRDTMGVAIR